MRATTRVGSSDKKSKQCVEWANLAILGVDEGVFRLAVIKELTQLGAFEQAVLLSFTPQQGEIGQVFR